MEMLLCIQQSRSSSLLTRLAAIESRNFLAKVRKKRKKLVRKISKEQYKILITGFF